MRTLHLRPVVAVMGVVLAWSVAIAPVTHAQTSPPVASPVPQQTFHADTELEALVPTTIAGQTLSIQSAKGSDLFASADADQLAVLTAALGAQGKTMDDVSVLFAYPPDYSFSITALRVRDGDANAFAPVILQSIDASASQVPTQVAGKSVTAVSSNGSTQYAYPQGDVLWVIGAKDPALTEILTALP